MKTIANIYLKEHSFPIGNKIISLQQCKFAYKLVSINPGTLL